MKYRSKGKVKGKHGMIDGLTSFLRKLESIDEVLAINPGEIKPGRLSVSSGFKVRIQYKTKSGLKLIARGQGIQEIFVVSEEPDILIEKMKKMDEVI